VGDCVQPRGEDDIGIRARVRVQKSKVHCSLLRFDQVCSICSNSTVG
jgi:hypothetical protein